MRNQAMLQRRMIFHDDKWLFASWNDVRNPLNSKKKKFGLI